MLTKLGLRVEIHCPQCRGTFRLEGNDSTAGSLECPFCQAAFSFRDKETVVFEEPRAQSPEAAKSLEAGSQPNQENNPELKDAEGGKQVGDRPAESLASFFANATTPTPPPPTFTDFSSYTDLEIGDVVDGYELEEIIGCGGMSVVFRANQLSLNRRVAFKVLRKDLSTDEQFAKRFRKEARALAELNHPNIVGVYDQGESDGNYYLVMELVDGVSLRDIMEEAQLSPEEALKIVPSLCAALEYAHERGLVHRDIKPENILIDQAGTPRIADFGLVRILGEGRIAETRLTKTQTVLGTIDYMSPEQREGLSDIDHRADIYSLGVVLYEMLTGELPIARFPMPSERAEVDSRLDEVVLKVLEKDRERRYQRASLVAGDIHQIQSSVFFSGGGTTNELGEPESTLDRLFAMIFSFPFFVFTAVLFIVNAAAEEEELVAFTTGLALPFYGTQLILNGFIPRVRIPRHAFFVRRPILTALIIVPLAMAILSEKPDQEAQMALLFTIGFVSSAAFGIALQKKRLFRHSRKEPRYCFRGRLVADSSWNLDSPSQTRFNESESGTKVRLEPQTPPPAEPARPAYASAESDNSPTSPPANEPARPRLSFFGVLSFFASIPVAIYAFGLLLFTVGLGGAEFLLNIDADYDRVREFLLSVWSDPSEEIHRFTKVIAGGLMIPVIALLIPIIVACPGVFSGRLRGSGFLIAAIFLWCFSLVVTGNCAADFVRVGRDYRQTATGGPHDSFEDLLQKATQASRNYQKLAYFHRAYSLSNLENPRSADPCASLVRIIALPDNNTNVRIAALILLEQIYGRHTLRTIQEQSVGQPWFFRMRTLANRQELNPELREAFREFLKFIDLR